MIKKQYSYSNASRYYVYETKDFTKIKSMNELCDLLLGVFKIKDLLYMQQVEIAQDICRAIKQNSKNNKIKVIHKTQYIQKGGKYGKDS